MNHVVWSAALDAGKWEAKVTRHGATEYQGILTVTDLSDGCIIHAVLVNVSYGGLFGPEASDEAEWRLMAIEAIDSPSYRELTGLKRYQVERLTDLGWRIIGMYDTAAEAKMREGDASTGNDVHTWDSMDKVIVDTRVKAP